MNLVVSPTLVHLRRMPGLRYLHLDVFTSTPLEGNQLAVFVEPPADISAAFMQRIAAEMNFSESTFLFRKEGAGDIRMRIFTPGSELPIAGHPTIGTTFALAHTGVIASGREGFIFELGVGPTPVSLEWKGGQLDFAWMTQPLPSFETAFDAAALAPGLGLEVRDTIPTLPAQVISCGVPFLFVPLASRSAVDRVSIDRRAYGGACRKAGLDELPLFIFTTERGADSGDEAVYSRMLAPGFGIVEDPATGSASGPLGCYLLHHRVFDAVRTRSIVSLQGAAMRRPSRIHISIDAEGERITRVRVGGRAVVVGGGEILEF
jgi:trans-2,3-dihydro-3-hydroxyanthranilate isomerase